HFAGKAVVGMLQGMIIAESKERTNAEPAASRHFVSQDNCLLVAHEEQLLFHLRAACPVGPNRKRIETEFLQRMKSCWSNGTGILRSAQITAVAIAEKLLLHPAQ